MCAGKPDVTVDELYETLKRTSLPTVLVEGVEDTIFYRRIEDDLRSLRVSILPVGDRHGVLELHRRISERPVSSPVMYLVDKDLWVYNENFTDQRPPEIVTTTGYSVENDLIEDGRIESVLTSDEYRDYIADLDKFVRWYALAVFRTLGGHCAGYKLHPNQILDDRCFYDSQLILAPTELYPDQFHRKIRAKHTLLVRGKSLLALLQRRLSAPKRPVKFSSMQLMEIAAAVKGPNYFRVCNHIREYISARLHPT